MRAPQTRRVCNAIQRDGTSCTFRARPGVGRCGHHLRQPLARPIGVERGMPVVAAVRWPGRRSDHDDSFVVDCPLCGGVHVHGAFDGPRVPHCHGALLTCYVLREERAS